MKEADYTRSINGGQQRLYRFKNGYGASVVKHWGSYGGDEGYWELAVTIPDSDDVTKFSLCYDTEVTDDVIGWLTDKMVDEILEQVAALPAAH